MSAHGRVTQIAPMQPARPHVETTSRGFGMVARGGLLPQEHAELQEEVNYLLARVKKLSEFMRQIYAPAEDLSWMSKRCLRDLGILRCAAEKKVREEYPGHEPDNFTGGKDE